MSKILISALALGFIGLAAQSASAADMAVKSPPPTPIATPVFSWTGFYIGTEFGYGNAHADTVRNIANSQFLAGTSFSDDRYGFFGGFDAGANYQLNWLVLGIEGDWQGTSVSGPVTEFGNTPAALATGNRTVETRETDWVATATGRAGIAWDRWMIYGKGGGAWRRINDSANNTTFTAAGGLVANSLVFASNESGYVVGGGIEWAPSDLVSVKLEYDWYNFGSNPSAGSVNLGTGVVTPPGDTTTSSTMWEIKGGVDLHFNGWLAAH